MTTTPDLSEELLAALRWLADHELWRDVYPDGPDMSVFDAIPPQHVRAAREVLGLTAADLGYHRSPNAKISGPEYAITEILQRCANIRHVEIKPDKDWTGEDMLCIEAQYTGRLDADAAVRVIGWLHDVLDEHGVDAWPLVTWRKV